MPSTARQARFAPIPASYSRLPHDDEVYVMKAFTRHCTHCSTCSDPYAAYLAGRSLCSKGLQRALDVTQYVFNKGGQAFSVVDLRSNQRCQIEIPGDCDAVRMLLKAIERGLHLRPSSSSSPSSSTSSSPSSSPTISTFYPHKARMTSYHDDNYYRHASAPRHITPERDLACDLKYAGPNKQSRSYATSSSSSPRYVTSSPRRFQQNSSTTRQRPASAYYDYGYY